MCRLVGRIQQIAHNKGITTGALERNIGASKGVLSRAINNGTDIQSKWIELIVENYPEINPIWLLTGKGEMITSNELPSSLECQPECSITSNNQPQGIPLIPIDAVAGFGSGDFDGVTIADCDTYTIPDFFNKGVDFLIRVSGTSMQPKYYNGDMLGCKKIKDILFIQWGNAYVIDSISQGVMVKRLFPEDEKHFKCVSDNKEQYPPFIIPKEDVRSISLVAGVIRLE